MNDATGRIYVADTGNDRVQQFGAAGAYLKTWGTPGSGEAPFHGPTGLAVTADGIAFVADAQLHQVLKVRLDHPPEAAGVTVTGSATVGQAVYGEYLFHDSDGDLESQSLYRWYRSSDPAGLGAAAIAGEEGTSYTLRPEDLAFEVTPMSERGAMRGQTVRSPFVGPVSQVPNQSPVRSHAFGDRTWKAGEPTVTQDVYDWFADPDGDPLVWSIQNTQPEVAEVALQGTTLSFTLKAEGSTVVTVTVSDQKGGQAGDSFIVKVEPASSGDEPPVDPAEPTHPTDPTGPTDPAGPTEPTHPSKPARPSSSTSTEADSGESVPSEPTVSQETAADGRLVSKVVFNRESLGHVFAAAASAMATIEIGNADPVVQIQLPTGALLEQAAKQRDAFLEIRTNVAGYRLPLSWMAGTPRDATLTVTLAELPDRAKGAVSDVAQRQGVQLIRGPVEYSLRVDDKEITDFNGRYVSGTVTLPASVDPGHATAVWVDSDNRLHFIPSVISGGTVTIRSPHNGVYAVIRWDKTFADLDAHWAKTDVERLANKLIVSGMTGTSFARIGRSRARSLRHCSSVRWGWLRIRPL